ncbi:HAD family hydrolase [Desulforamulus ruminis]|uniref:D-glycero-alpha-D-manno-heptose-1,7-bisphosphate 7-phosphatase n=1 Tax=Desulforamulus ruminis TaxID=1564 RepID=UPI002FDA04B3
MKRRPALFLDRDGVINSDHGYVYKQENFQFIEGIFELCRTAKQLGYLIFVVTNQAGIGRGYYTEQDFLELTDWMCGVFSDKGIVIDGVYFCPYHPEHAVGQYKVDSPYRKPGPGMILQAAEEFDIDLVRSVLVGDKETDILAGMTAGVGCNLLYCASGSYDSIITTASTVISRLSQVERFLLCV